MNDITQPLRLAAGSHQAGSGKGCAMNVVSWENGDTKITDFPPCSARPLARIVQQVNDALADGDGFLSPENSVIALELGHLTVGTSGYTPMQMRQWLHDLLVDPERGVARHASPNSAVAIRRVAALLVDEDTAAMEFRQARDAAYATTATAYAGYVASAAANAYADNAAAADAYAADAAYAAYAANAAAERVNFARWAVQRFRDILGLDAPAIDPAATAEAVEKMTASR